MNGSEHATVPLRRLEELPRPVVAFLTGRCRIPLRRALVTCLRDLDKEGLVRFGADAGGTPVISPGAAREPWSGRSLLPYEEVALERVRTRLGQRPTVPLSALLSDDGDDYKHWAKRQVNEIRLEARRGGLATRAFPARTWPVAFSLIAMAIGAAIAVHVTDPKAARGVTDAAVAVVLLLLCAPFFLFRWRLTAEGAAAVDSWRRDGQGMAGTPRVPGAVGQQTLWALTTPSGAPLPPGHAWSSLGGQWHVVRLGLELRRPYWSGLPGLRTLLSLTVMASFFTVIIGVTQGLDAQGKLIALAPAALGALAILAFWLPAFSLRMGLPDNATFTGEVVRQWHADGGEYSPDHDWVCIDDGSPTTMRFDVPPGTYQQLSVGDLVHVSWSPRHRRLNHIQRAR